MNNPILHSDSYKFSHWMVYPEGAEYASSYIESRGGKWNENVFFGLQYILKTMKKIKVDDVKEAKPFIDQQIGPEIFNYEGWMRIATEFKGNLPLRIEAVPEGTIIDGHNVLVQITNTHPDFAWLPSFVETFLLRVWYPISVATLSYHCRKDIEKFLKMTADVWENKVDFVLNDFGQRGVSSAESASIGGAAHLLNFKGTDTIEGVKLLIDYYSAPVAGYSIPATEHSISTAYGLNEEEYVLNVLEKFAKPGNIFAMVADTYDIFGFIDMLGRNQEIKNKIINHGKMGGFTVIRPDSGNPMTIPVEVIARLDSIFGHTVNSKGFKVLNYVRAIQGDGINSDTIPILLKNVMDAGYSTENLALGMGGKLLQGVDRDTLKFAMKSSAICINGVWKEIYKDPITDHGKVSKKGILALIKENGHYKTVKLNELNGRKNYLETVWENGELVRDMTYDEIISHMKQ